MARPEFMYRQIPSPSTARLPLHVAGASSSESADEFAAASEQSPAVCCRLKCAAAIWRRLALPQRRRSLGLLLLLLVAVGAFLTLSAFSSLRESSPWRGASNEISSDLQTLLRDSGAELFLEGASVKGITRRFTVEPRDVQDARLVDGSWYHMLGLPALFGPSLSAELREISAARSPLPRSATTETITPGVNVPSIFSVLLAEWRRTELFPEDADVSDLHEYYENGAGPRTSREELLAAVGRNRRDCQLNWLELRRRHRAIDLVPLTARTETLVQRCWNSEWDLLAKSGVLSKPQIRLPANQALINDTLAWYPQGVWTITQSNGRLYVDRANRPVYGCGTDVEVSFASKRSERPEASDFLPFLRAKESENLQADAFSALVDIRSFWSPELVPARLRQERGGLEAAAASSVPGHPPKLALLMLAVSGLEHPEVWEDWVNEANEWSKAQFLAREGPYKEVPRESAFEPLLKVLLHVPAGSGSGGNSLDDDDSSSSETHRASVLANFPLAFQHGAVPAVQCAWGNLNFCGAQLLRYAVADPAVAWMSLVSDSSIPLKPFREMYNNWAANPRSYLDFLAPRVPLKRKHTQWLGLTRAHALDLLARPDRWMCKRWLWYRPPHLLRFWALGWWAAPDEYLPFHALYEARGNALASEINHGEPLDLLSTDDLMTTENPVVKMRHWLCWTSWTVVNCRDFGEGAQLRMNSPFTFTRLYASKLEQLIRNPGTWFMRKVARDALVGDEGDPGLPLRQYLHSQFNLLFPKSAAAH